MKDIKFNAIGVNYVLHKVPVFQIYRKLLILAIISMNLVKEAGSLTGCPKDVAKTVLLVADYVADHNGGDGAVRDFIEWLVE